jgi:uncharacterized cupredoxin-like copper-binding protein
MHGFFRGLTAALIFGLVLPGCGGGGAEQASTHLTVDMTEFAFSPRDYTVPVGAEITLDLSNNGAIEHNFVIMELGTEVTTPFNVDDEANVYWRITMPPGQETTTSFAAPSEPGEYQLICSTAGHVEAGMVGTLTVVTP